MSSLKIEELVNKIEQKVSDHRAATTDSVSCKTSMAAAALVGGGVTVKAVPAKAVPALSYLEESSLQAKKSEGGVNPSQ